MNQNTLWWQWILGPECSCRCGARVPLRFDPNRYDELKTLFLAVANGILDQNAPVGVTRAFPLTLTPIVAMSPKCCFCCGEWNLGPQCSCRCDTRDAALNQTCCFCGGEWNVGPQCSCRCDARILPNIDANRCDESKMLISVVANGSLDHRGQAVPGLIVSRFRGPIFGAIFGNKM